MRQDARHTVESGLDMAVRRRRKRFRDVRIGLIAHQASVDCTLRHAVTCFESIGARLVAIFAPEHGVAGTEQDLRPVSRDTLGGHTVHSLYGEHLGPTPEMLDGIDLMVFDLQDIGSRYYTFISTMFHTYRACTEAGIELMVLDRPNPIGGISVEGNVVEPTHLSYVGIHPMPARHGMTVGELASMMRQERSIRGKLEIVAMRGWRRRLWYDQIRLQWVMPSPNMPALDTATVYPGMCLIEGTNLSEGRGTTRPFELFGAPWLDQHRMRCLLREARLPGVVFREAQFKPTFNKYAGQVCRGFQIHVTDRERFKPYLTGIAVLRAALALHRADFAWRPPPYEFETQKLPIDILLGSTHIRRRIEAERPLREIEATWQCDLSAFRRRRRRFLLYDA
ncbi:MAG: DUF1343 domain-containing protein [Acidobacteriota bacterium]